jgi:hypothetical protein
MTQQPAAFGRRRAPDRPSLTAAAAPPVAGGAKPTIGEQLRGPVLKMLVLIPAIMGAIMLLVFMINRSGSGSSDCHAKATAGTVFDIDWCRSAAAAARGAATGVAAGAGAGRR